MNDLTEDSLVELLETIRREKLTFKPTKITFEAIICPYCGAGVVSCHEFQVRGLEHPSIVRVGLWRDKVLLIFGVDGDRSITLSKAGASALAEQLDRYAKELP